MKITMQQRQINIVSTQTNNIEQVESSARTLGELKQEVSGISWANKNLIVRETRNSLEVNDAELPSGGFTLYVMPQKTKSGTIDIDNLKYNDLRRLAKRYGIPYHHQLKEDLKAQIKHELAAEEGASPSYVGKNLVVIIDQIRAHVNDKLDELEYHVQNSSNGANYEDFREDIEKLARELGVDL